MTLLYTPLTDTTIGSKAIIISEPSPESAITQGYFEEDFNILEKSAIKNNLSEQDSINLIDSLRNELPMNQ